MRHLINILEHVGAKDFTAAVNEVHDPEGNAETAILQVCEQNEQAAAEFLMEFGANIKAVDGHGRTAAHKAAWQGNTELVRWLVQENEINPTMRSSFMTRHCMTLHFGDI